MCILRKASRTGGAASSSRRSSVTNRAGMRAICLAKWPSKPERVSEIPPSRDDEADADREIRIEKMRRELDELAGGSMISGELGDVPPTIEEAFLARACAFERAELDTNFNRLVQHGIAMEPPAELDDGALSAKLEEVLRVLATMSCFVEQTDHLSGRELYTWLWTDGLREETPDLLRLGGAWHTSPIGSCDDEDTVIFLKYYANEDERRRWHEQFPNDVLPPRQPLPYDRDRNLPRSEIY
jgi:hypothetical protein